MTTNNSSSSPTTTTTTDSSEENTKIPIEIISEEEMALIEAAFAASAAMPAAASHLHRNSRSLRSITLLSKRGLSACTNAGPPDIEDSGRASGSNSPQKNKRNRVLEPFLHRFRKGRGLSVTDLTGTEWCEKQTEFILLFGKPKKTKAMKAGSARHVVLEKEIRELQDKFREIAELITTNRCTLNELVGCLEALESEDILLFGMKAGSLFHVVREEKVIKRVKVQVECAEDVWALKFMNFILGTNQLLFDGLTRELPLVGFVEGVWMVGIIDEIRMPVSESTRFPVLVDTKTRVRPTLPGEPQKRNGRFQLMCYKYMWDTVVADKFASQKFFDFFSLNPNHILSPEIRDSTAKSGFPSETLSDVVRYFGNSCCLLPKAHDQLLLRYELQEDESLLGEDEFAYDLDLVKDQIKSCLEFWMGKKEPSYPPMEELWKCKFCKFASVCPVNSEPDASSSKTKSECIPSPTSDS